MRPLPEIRSRSQINASNSSSSSNGVVDSSSPDSNQKLTNGSVKEPILTRSKTVKLKLRRRPSRSPLKPQGPSNKNYRSDSSNGSPKRKEKTTTSQEDEVRSKATGLYARHYKSYRRSGLSSSIKEESDGPFSPQNNNNNNINTNSHRSLNSKRLRPYGKNGVKSPTGSSLRSGVSYKSRTTAIEKRKKIGNLLAKNKGRPKKLVSSTSSSTTVTPLSSPTSSSHFTSDPLNKDKGAKRRSALWVLNCEAEEFLFGETAADKHELELPPSTDSSSESPPPKKRRRWRETELSHLLQTSPFLESKLRSCSSSSESGHDSFNASPPPKRSRKFKGDERPKRPAGKGKPRPACEVESSSSSPPPMCSNIKPISTARLDNVAILRNLELLSPTTSIRSNYSTSRDPPSDLKTVQVRQMLSTMPWRFSFEDPPVDECWYATFSRLGDAIMSHTSFLTPNFEPVILPYEMDRPFRRSRIKLPKNARKSPRCHASTLAILSSEKPTRSTRNSVTATESIPPPPVQASVNPTNTPVPSFVSSPLPLSPPVTTTTPSNQSTPSPITKFMRENCMPLRGKSPNSTSARVVQNGKGQKDLSAQQYLWDSIQFLSDPYVVALLSGDETEGSELLPVSSIISSKSRSRQNSSYNGAVNGNTIVCPVKKLVQNFEALERKASLRSCDSGSSSSSNGTVNVTAAPNKDGSRFVPVPKSSPRNHSNHVNGTSVVVNNSGCPSAIRLLALNGISKSTENRSPKFSNSTSSDQKVHNNNNISRSSSNHANGKFSKATKSNNMNSKSGCESKSKAPTEMEDSSNSSSGRRGKPSTRRSPVVMVSDIFRNGKTKAKKLILEEELLFVGDGLPPLPSWPP